MSVFKQLRQRRLGKEEALLDREIDSIQRIMEDEAYQNTFLDAAVASRLGASDGVDRLADGSGEFGFDPANPIPVNGPLGAITYLSRLKTRAGERLFFQCVGASEQVHAFEAASYPGHDWYLLFFDIYHPRKSTALPKGFEFSGDVAMFSGFFDKSADFPEDYSQRVAQLDALLQPAYAPETRFSALFGHDGFHRPLAHWAKLEALQLRGIA